MFSWLRLEEVGKDKKGEDVEDNGDDEGEGDGGMKTVL